jgi:thymidylate synthase (FAD)
MTVSLIQATPNPIETIAQIASICYDSDPKNPLGLVKHLYRNGHHSVFEHIYFTFKIEGISRACSHQLVRHRHCSFTQRSQRYCSEDGYDFVNPVENIKDINHIVFNAMVYANSKDYAKLQNLGLENEDARYILPNACATELYLSCNLRELIHLCNERLCYRAQWEIRDLVMQMVSLINKDLWFMFVPKCKSGRIICNNPCNKGNSK